MLTGKQEKQRKEQLNQRIEQDKQRIELVKKRIKRDKQKIDLLLAVLGDNSLTQSHNSVISSFMRMLAYIDKTSTSGTLNDIKFLLKTYREMAERFYTQYELKLLEEIQAQGDVQKQSVEALNKVQALADLGLETLLVKTRDDAFAEQTRLIKIFPTQLQKALDKLKLEWQRLNSIAVASKTLAKKKKLIQAMEVVVEAARFSVGTTAVDRIAIVPGDAFALQFYSYLKNFAVLIVPIYSVQAPWEWSIFWHELAGDKVDRLEKDTAIEINELRDKLKLFHKQYQTMNVKERERLLETITRNNQYPSSKQSNPSERKNIFSQAYLHKVFSKSRLYLSDLGGFEHQFERTLDKLTKKDQDKFSSYEQIKEQGWCVDWIKELFEDAWSVLAIRKPFLKIFYDILSRHVATDGRHPPLDIRIHVAHELLKLMEPKTESDLEKIIGSPFEKWTEKESIATRIAAEQILNFISLLIAASHKFESTAKFKTPYTYVDIYKQEAQRLLTDVVGREIGEYIGKWSTELKVDFSANQSQKYAQQFIEAFSDEQTKDFIQGLTDPNKNEIKASYEELLDDKDYEQLLELSFYDIDFGAVVVYTISMGDTSFSYLGALPTDTIGTVTYTANGTGHTTNPSTWNVFFGDKIKL